MEIIFHIGMGKTGTSSIQKALNDNADSLRTQGVDYLGMWFDLIDPTLRNDDLQRQFFASSADRLDAVVDQFLNALRQKQADSGISRFLLSNESLLQQHQALGPFIARLKHQMTVRVVVYARDPRDWLPSAYNQWFIYHKTSEGPIPPYAEGGRSLLKMYDDLRFWHQLFQDVLTVRPYSKTTNVTQDFADSLGIVMEVPSTRVLERVETSESLLRAIYNSQLPGKVMPDRFDCAFRRLDFARSPSIAALVRDSFTYGQTDEILAEQAALFEEIRDKLGLDLLSGPAPAQKTVDLEEMRHRALEHVLQIVMQQADRITHLEQTVRRLEAVMKDK